jgi:transposase
MGRLQTHGVHLTEEERATLLEITSKGTLSAREMKRAQILLACDKSFGEGLEDEEVAKILNTSKPTVYRTRRSFHKTRLEGLKQQKGAGRPRIVDGDVEAHIIAVACSPPPEGRVRWTLHLIANKVVYLTDLDSVSHQTVKNTLKKMNLSLG